MRSHSYINTAQQIIEQFNGSVPLSVWLKSYFTGQKKFGSKDRKIIGHLCYSYFRLGNAFHRNSIDERLLMGIFLSGNQSQFVLQELKPEWNEIITCSIEEKLKILNGEGEEKHLFPFQEHLSREIDRALFNTSFLIQPSLYLRIRPGHIKTVIKKLNNAPIPFQFKEQNCIELDNGIKLEEVLFIDKEVVIQDWSSQKVLDHFKTAVNENDLLESWDCCAASGGKSILLKDHFPNIYLTVSDIRPSILHNLRNRFQRAGIQHYQNMVLDVTKPDFKMDKTFDLILCDAPCSGSGTWSRTPEQLHFFKKEQIKEYAILQKRIAENASWYVKSGGYFLYVTCSVFNDENEAVVEHIMQNTPLKLLHSTYHKGYDNKADTLFSALFQLP